MKTEHAFLFLISLLDFGNTFASIQLEEFLKSIEDAHSELQWVESVEGVNRQKRSATIDELLARFEFENEDDLVGGDVWYQSFRAMECQHGGCPKRELRWKTRNSEPDEIDEYDEENGETDKDFKDQWEETKNDLSHEANYKLSKVEQDAAEKSLPNTAWPVRHSVKRYVDPMRVVKLKTSLRMLSNGDGPSLPSSVLDDDGLKITIDDILADTKHDESPDPWKESYEVRQARKLLSIEDPDSDHMSEKICRSGHCLGHALDMEQFDNMKEKSDLDRRMEGLSFDNTESGNTHHPEKKGTFTKLSDDLMHSTAFLKLQNFLRGKSAPSNGTKSEETSSTIRPGPLNFVDKGRDVNINLHMSVNATVLGDGKLPEQFHRNNTISFKPSPGMIKKAKKKDTILGLNDFDLDRDRRAVVFPILTGNSKRRTNKDIRNSVIEATDSFPLDELITGKLTSHLVNTIFSLVKSSSNLKVLWPGLMRNKITSGKQVKNFYAIRTHDNESEMHRTEVMLRQAMETINAIIEQQVRSRSCVPLRADLKDFYNLILATKAENDQLQDRPKRENPAQDTTPISDSQIRNKSRIVKKLLKDYEELPSEDQDQVANIKGRLLMAASYLQDLEQRSKRRKRHLFETQTPLLQPPVDIQLTPQYLKLAKTATELLLQSSPKDPELSLI